MRALSPSLRHALPFAVLALVGCSSEEPLVDATPALGTTAPSATSMPWAVPTAIHAPVASTATAVIASGIT